MCSVEIGLDEGSYRQHRLAAQIAQFQVLGKPKARPHGRAFCVAEIPPQGQNGLFGGGCFVAAISDAGAG